MENSSSFRGRASCVVRSKGVCLSFSTHSCRMAPALYFFSDPQLLAPLGKSDGKMVLFPTLEQGPGAYLKLS